MVTLDPVYRERSSRIAGSTVWTSTGDGSTTRVLPDGCMDLIWWDGKLLIAGPDTQAFLSYAEPGTTITGLRLAPGLAPSILGIPASEFRNQRVDITQVWNRAKATPWLNQLTTARHPGHVLERMASRNLDVDRAVGRTVQMLAAGIPVSAIAEELNTSERQLHRRSLTAFGYSPKTLARILRFATALELARAGIPLAQSAFDAGYADQAHLARDTKSLAGVPMTALL